MANSISHASLPYPIKNARYTLMVPYLDADGDPTDPTTPDTEVSQDAGAFADAAEEVTTISGTNGLGYITLTGAEMNNSAVGLAFKVASGPKATLMTLNPYNLAIVGSGTLSAGSAGGGTLGTVLAYDVCGCFIRTTGGTGGGGTGGANNQARRIITYTKSTGAFTVSPNWETTPDATTTYDVLLPDGVTLGMLKTLNPVTAGREAVVDAAGLVDANTVKVGPTASGTAQTAGDIPARLPAALTANGNMKSSLMEIIATALTETSGLLAGGFKKFFNVATPTGTVNSLADVVPGAAGGGFIAGTNAATTITTGLTSNLIGNITGNLSGSVGSLTTNNDKTGYGISAASVQAIWDALTSALTTVGSVGKRIADFLTGDAYVRIGAAGVSLTSVGIAAGGINRAAFAADTGLVSIRSNTAQAGASTSITLDASASAVTDFYKNDLIVITGGTGIGQARYCTAYNGTTKVATVSAWATNPDVTSTFAVLAADAIVGATAPTAAAVATAVWTDLLAGSDFSTVASVGKLLKDDIDAAISSRLPTANISLSGGAVTVGTNNDKTGYGITAASVQAIWDALTSALSTANSIGKKLVDNITGVLALDSTVAKDATVAKEATVAALNNISQANVLTQVNAALDAANTEVTGVPASTASLRDMVKYVFAWRRNKKTQTATTMKLRNNADAADIASSTVGDDGTVLTIGKDV